MALGLRLGFVANEPYHAVNDAGTYNRMASMVATFGDYHTGSGPRTGAGGSRGPTAYFPPAFPYYLALADVIDGHQQGGKQAVSPERVEMAITGTIAVALVGLVALEAFGAGTALVAMGLAAVYPVMIELSGTLVAENLEVVVELAAAWALLRARRARWPLVWIAGTGVLTGLAALTHENAALYAIPFAFGAWALMRSRQRPGRSVQRRRSIGGWRALAGPLVLIIFTCAAIAPWTIRNAVELHSFVPISDETGITLAGTYNPYSAGDPQIPFKWHLFSRTPQLHYLAPLSNRLTEPQLSSKLVGEARSYIQAHPGAPLRAAWDNTRRMLELEGGAAWHASAQAVGLRVSTARVGVIAFYVLGVLALLGAFTRAARRAPLWLWAMPVLWWITTVFVNVETPRFREPIDPFLILLAACALATAAARARLGLSRAPVGRGGRTSQLSGDEAQLVKMVKRLA